MRIAALFALASLAAGCGSQRVTLAVHAGSPLADSPVEVDVRGLDGPARLRARWRDLGGTVWTSSTPLQGSARLRGVAGMRFLWGMRPPHPAVPQDFRPPPTGPSPVALSVVQGGRTVARATLSRRVTPATVRLRRLTVERDGVRGDLFTPRNPRPHPAVLLFGGSDGGNTMVDQAGLLAAHGYTTLSIAYFAAPGVPKHLLEIPLEYFARAAHLLRRQPHVTRVVPMGVSRGGEAALLIASEFPHLFRGAIGLVPSSQVNGSNYRFDRAAWTFRGRPLAAGTQIAVERISGPILTTGAGEDTVWDSALWVHEIERRLRDRQFRFPHAALTYPRAGHLAGVALPYLPAPTVQDEFGGSARGDAAAKADLWPRILRFLAALSPPRG